MKVEKQRGTAVPSEAKRAAIRVPLLGRLRTSVQVLSNRARPGNTAEHLRSAMQWLCRAQDATGTGGISYGYGLLKGWWPAYPETTGYSIPTFLRYAKFTGEKAFSERALAMAEWELSIQAPDGGFAGGPSASNGSGPAVAFDTGQVLQGLVAIYCETGGEEFLRAAERAGQWLIERLSADGTWHDALPHRPKPEPHAYNARTSWALLELFETTGKERYREAARLNLEWVVRCQLPNGWFRNNAFEPGQPALTHTIAYALEGLLESSTYLHQPRLVEATLRGAETLREQFERRGWLAATFNDNWESRDRYSCVTGCAQVALVWIRLFELTGQASFRDAALHMTQYLKGIQISSGADPSAEGGIPGSYPLYGAYERLRLPNWAAKFFADAMLAEIRLRGRN
jgi:rhamnogalacturonyl hydrolase YesR